MEVRKGVPKSRVCGDCGKLWIFYYRKAMDLIKDGNVMNFKVCSDCAAIAWSKERKAVARYLH